MSDRALQIEHWINQHEVYYNSHHTCLQAQSHACYRQPSSLPALPRLMPQASGRIRSEGRGKGAGSTAVLLATTTHPRGQLVLFRAVTSQETVR